MEAVGIDLLALSIVNWTKTGRSHELRLRRPEIQRFAEPSGLSQ